jgi:serine/threonine protein kinase
VAEGTPGARLVPLTVKEYSDTLLLALLKAHRPEKYRDNVRVEGAGPQGAHQVNAGHKHEHTIDPRAFAAFCADLEEADPGHLLPFAATMDPRQLQRFHNEARAAALEHPHIVPVYGVGCERAVHFYAMKFIDGRTLAELIAQQRHGDLPAPPTVDEAAARSASTVPPAAQATSAAPRDAAYYRRAAEWGIQAAEALEHAHQQGVVHRNVKPANLMIDAQGKLWVTDFGLARSGAGSDLTMAGDMLGTLRYMSPEQALAKHGLVDHRTDVYSLGVTLYELLTLRPAIDGRDREEILRHIAFAEPRPPRALNPAIPRDLETILVKATAKEATERYGAALVLANGPWRRPEPWTWPEGAGVRPAP